ncbi:hypothetical protein [Actinoplanes sichuanensis]|uniref:NACHT domain-containing protein n=2 Tax=Actinoplanes sichuanensis TaxID=512349 RepID=A0ABW4AYT5_9ACTN
MSPKATGGSGVHYEAEVVACALALLLTGHRGPVWNQPISTLSVQQRAAGAQLDDMVLQIGTGTTSRIVECQIKITATASALRQVMTAAARMQRMNRSHFIDGRCRVGLVTRTSPKATALRQLAELAERTSFDAFRAQLTPGQTPMPIRREWNSLRQGITDRDAHRMLGRLDVWIVDRDGRSPDVDYLRILDTVTHGRGVRSEDLYRCLTDVAGKLAESGGDTDAERLRHRLALDYGIPLFPTLPTTAAAASIGRFLPRGPLADREAELELLGRHCTSDEEPAYLCWRGPAWAGKTAMLAWFARHPPAGVRVLASFVTARSGVQHRHSFVDDQLAQLTEQFGFAPETLRPSGLRDGVLLARWAQAAAACAARGELLVVVVDGLDEDTAARFEPSIASLLPDRVPVGLRFVVSIRDRRPVPEDLEHDHPLRATGWTRLTPSPAATTQHVQARVEATRLWRDQPVGRQILGLITAAQGALTRHDLAALCGEDPGTVDELIASCTARAIGQDPDGGHVLIHDDLHAAVTELFDSLDTFHARIDAWADDHQAAGWPANTPRYLLDSYPWARRQSPQRLLALATDVRRHDRLFSHTGADVAALREITLAESAHRTAATPDLGALLRLALHRQRLTRQTRVVPAALPPVVAAVQGWERAVDLAMSSDLDSIRDQALVELMDAAETPAQCLHLIDRISSPVAKALAQVRASAVLGDLPTDFGAGVTEPDARAHVLEVAARTLDADQTAAAPWWQKLVHDVHDAVRAVDNRLTRGLASARLARLPGADVHTLLTDAVEAVRGSDSILACVAMRKIAVGLAGAGAVDRAIAVAESVSRPYDDWALSDVAAQMASVDAVAAERLAVSIPGIAARISAVAAVSHAHARAGRRADALRLGLACRDLLDGDSDIVLWEGAHAAAAAALAAAGDLGEAAAVARAAYWYLETATALAVVAAAAVEHGDLTAAAHLVREAQQVVRTDEGHDEGLIEVLDQLRSDRPYRPPSDPVSAEIDDLLDDGHVEAAEQLARQLGRGSVRDEAMSQLASAVAAGGDPDRGESLIDEIDDPRWQTEALMWLARHAEPAEYAERLPALVDRAYRWLRRPVTAVVRTNLICTIAEQDPEQAAELARRAFDENDDNRAHALAAIAWAAHPRALARDLLAEVLRLESFEPAIAVIALIEPAALRAAAADRAFVPPT